MRVAIVGTGYVGLVSGACLAELGHEVVCIDLDQRKVDMINSGTAPIHEAGLPALMQRHVGTRLRAVTDLKRAVAESEITFIAVGTPAADGRIDLRHVERAADEIGSALKDHDGYHTVIVKSTVIPGTTDGSVRQHLEAASGKLAGRDFGLGMNPEFLTEGTAVEDFSTPDRLVFGGIDHRTHAVLGQLYADFSADVPRILTNTSTAEMIKYASNAVLATMISFSNEIARLCSAVGAVDAIDVMRGVHQSTYFTSRKDGARTTAAITSFLEPGCGFGGSCLPKDVTAMIGQAAMHQLQLPLLRSVLEINRGQVEEVLRLVHKHYSNLQGVSVTLLGIAFKPDTDDVRESPAFPLMLRLKGEGARVTAYDPVARPLESPALDQVNLASSLEQALDGAEIVILVTRWQQFLALPQLLQKLGLQPLVVDGRRVLRPQDYVRYEGIGR
jgi:UDPglucose 6-dehydrogenase